MGNTESNVDSSASRSGSTGPAVHSPSPLGHRRTGSCRKSTERSMSVNLRRSKSCRGKDRHTRRAICTTTGLTLHQKALLTRKWNRMDRATVYELGKMMFESVFNDNPQWLVYIDLKDEHNWSSHINFKIHVQRFVTALVECMRRLKEPSSACDILRDFGALYANQTKRVSAQYFERLANSLNRAAALLQEADHLQIEKTENRLDINSDAPDWERSSTSNSTVTTSTLPPTPSSIHTIKSATTVEERDKKKFRPLVSRHSETQIELEKRRTSHSRSRCCSSNEEPHVCPITAEAWVVLSAFLANQIKLGYELERMLKNEMDKLGLGELTLIAPTSALDIDLAKRPVHANS